MSDPIRDLKQELIAAADRRQDRAAWTRRRRWRDHVELHGKGRRQRAVVLAATAVIVAVVSTSAFATVRDLLFGAKRSAYSGAPAWSPDGRRIAFVTAGCGMLWCDGRLELNVMNADGSGQRNLTREWEGRGGALALSYAGLPVWSPDWRRVAFVQQRGGYRSRGGDRYSDIYVMNEDGSERRRLTRSPQNDGDPVWSPDGRRLAFVRIQGGQCRSPRCPLKGRAHIYVVNVDGSGLRRLAHAITFAPLPGTPSAGLAASPEWSPDGSKIAFVDNRDGTADISVVSADGSGLRHLTRTPGTDRRPSWSQDGPAWSPDGRQIAVRSDRDRKEGEIYLIDADGSGVRRLTRNWKADGGPVWSPDGRKILFLRSAGPGRWSYSTNGDVWVMNADGSGQRNLTRSQAHPFATDRSPVWSPDGRKIVFVSNRDRNGEIYVMNADGTGKRNLTQLKGRE
jgi:Tol biopolymer transport system component